MREDVVVQMKRYQLMGTKAWDYRIAARDLPCQVGSLTKLLMQLDGERYRHNKTDAELKNQIADELADIMSLVLFIAHELDIDVEKAWEAMLKSDDVKIGTRTSNSHEQVKGS